jgi:hypothetical protein
MMQWFLYREAKVKLAIYGPWRPLGLRVVEAHTFSDIRFTHGGEVCQPLAPAAFYSQEDSWYSFLFDAELTGRIR